jgi:hypothetical protein
VAKRNRQNRRLRQDVVPPTDEQMAGGVFRLEDIVDRQGTGSRIGKAYRRQPMILSLRVQGLIDAEQFRALSHYRHHADLANRSPLRDSLCLQRGGAGPGPSVSILNASRVRDDCERAAGSLADILRAVVIEDMSLSQWAMNRYGVIEERDGNVSRPKPQKRGLQRAQLEIKVAAQRVQAELDA